MRNTSQEATLEAEFQLVSAILRDNSAIHTANVSESDFSDPALRTIFSSLREEIDSGRTGDGVTVFNKHPELGETILALGDEQRDTKHAATYAKIVRTNSANRKLKGALRENLEGLETGRISEQEAYAAISDLEIGSTQPANFVCAKENLKEAFDYLAEMEESGPGISTGFVQLDEKMIGFTPGHLTVLGARPSMGKTTLALNFAENACRRGKRVLFISLEMPGKEIMLKMISSVGSVDSMDIFSANLTSFQKSKMQKASEIIEGFDFSVLSDLDHDHRSLTSAIKAEHKKKPVDFVIIDYLQLVPAGEGVGGNRVNEVSTMTRAIKIMAMSLNVPVLLLSQLSRNLESRSDKRPILSDLRESGSIEQDADNVLFIYNPKPEDEDDEMSERIAEVNVAKIRRGRTGTTALIFEGQYSRFTSYLQSIIKIAKNEDHI